MKKTLFFIVFVWVVTSVQAQYTAIPDVNFEQALINNGIDSEASLDGQVLTADISGVVSLFISSYNITDLSGIEDFTALENLYCSDNQLTSLDVSQNTNLTQLWCDSNLLASLDVSQNPNLTQLHCYGNQLATLDVSQNTNLNELICESNQLATLDVSQNINLNELICDNNQLVSLDVSQNTNLNSLLCHNNQLAALDVSQNPNLTQLYCYGNQLASLDVSQNTNLIQLWCYNNQLIGSLLVDGLNALTNFNATGNPALTCIQVDNAADADAGIGQYVIWNKDMTASYSENCPTPIPDTALGEGSGSNSTGEANTFIGYNSGFNTSTGNFNTFIGSQSGYSNAIGNENTYLGANSGYSGQTSSGNVFLGYRTGYNETGSDLLYIDNSDTDTPLIWGSFEADSLRVNGRFGISNIPQDDDLTQVLVTDIDGNIHWKDATSLGDNHNFPSYPNNAGDGGGSTNAYFGNRSGANSTGAANTFIGSQSGINNTVGANNTFVGRNSGYHNTFGDNNIAIGSDAGPDIGLNNLQSTVAIGNGATVTGDNAIAIGEGASAGEDEVRLGNMFTSSIGGYTDWVNISDGRFKKNIREDIPGLDFITQLRPVSYELDRSKLYSFLTGEASTREYISERASGFIAQEVETIVDEHRYSFFGVEKPQNKQNHYGIKYAEFVVPLVKGMQEQQELIEVLRQQNEILQQKVAQLENMVYGSGSNSPSSSTSLKEMTSLPEGFSLEQNIPNPFDQTTTIITEVPETVTQAKIVIYSLNGIELRSYPLNERGRTFVKIEGGSLQSGMYLYALLADGQLIDTKKMILTK